MRFQTNRKTWQFAMLSQLSQNLVVFGFDGGIGYGIIKWGTAVPGSSIEIQVTGNHVPDTQGSCFDCGV